MIELSLEQQFKVRSFGSHVEQMNEEETRRSLMKLYEHMMLRENAYKQALLKSWGIDSAPILDTKKPDA